MECPRLDTPWDLSTPEGVEQSRLRGLEFRRVRRELREACMGICRNDGWDARRIAAARLIWAAIQNPSPALQRARLKWFIGCIPGKRTTDAREILKYVDLNEEWHLRCLEPDEWYRWRSFWRAACQFPEDEPA